MASVYPSSQWTTVQRNALPVFAGSDIWWGAPVCIASAGDWQVVMCASSNQKPIGIARDYAAAGKPVDVWDFGNVQRAWSGAGGSLSRQSYVGVVGTSSGVHPITGVTVTYPVIGQVAPAAGATGVGGSGAALYALGVAWESAAAGDQFAFRIEPQLLSGLVNSN